MLSETDNWNRLIVASYCEGYFSPVPLMYKVILVSCLQLALNPKTQQEAN